MIREGHISRFTSCELKLLQNVHSVIVSISENHLQSKMKHKIKLCDLTDGK